MPTPGTLVNNSEPLDGFEDLEGPISMLVQAWPAMPGARREA